MDDACARAARTDGACAIRVRGVASIALFSSDEVRLAPVNHRNHSTANCAVRKTILRGIGRTVRSSPAEKVLFY
jgi:hypothetical protein